MNRFATLRIGYATLLLAAPGPVIRGCTGHQPDPVTRTVARLLGARHLIQGVLTAGAPSAVVLAVGVEVDLAHAASMLGLAMLDPRRRRAGLRDAAVAATLAAMGVLLAGRTPARNPNGRDLGTRLDILRHNLATRIAQRTLPRPIYHHLRHLGLQRVMDAPCRHGIASGIRWRSAQAPPLPRRSRG